MTFDTTNWKYYYKTKPNGQPSDSNLLYTPTVNPEGNVMCMHYCVDQVYRKYATPISEELIDWFFTREARFLTELEHLDSTPTVYEIDTVNRKIFIEWNKETLSQIVFNSERNLDEELPDWREQLGVILKNIQKQDYYKMSLYPHCFFIDKNRKIKTIDYYSVVPYSERFIDRNIIEEIIGREGAYRFDESTEDGKIDFKKFFEITATRHLEIYWPGSPFPELFKEMYPNG